MNDHFARAMRRSLEQVRAGDPAGATRLIQEALRGGLEADPGAPPEASRALPGVPRDHSPAPGDALGGPAAMPPEPGPGGAGRQAEPAPGGAGRRAEPAPGAAFRQAEPARGRPVRPGPAHPRRAPEAGIEDAEVVREVPPRRPLREVIAGLARRPDRPGRAPRPPGGPVLPETPPGARFERRHHAGPAGARDYRLYLPSTHAQGVAGLVVMLHGCTQSPEDFAAGTGMNAVAERHGFAVAWPEQTRAQNASLCWNWFRPQDQGRGGEAAILQGLAAAVAAELSAPRVFVAGLSAGGAMAAILGQAYPETFAAVGVHSGLAPGSARDVISAFATMRGDAAPSGRAVGAPVIVFQGTADRTVAPVNAGRVTGRLTGAARRAGRAPGRGFTVTEGRNAAGHPVELWSIEGAGHAWAGGSPAGSYTDPAGPDASAEMLRFFRACGKTGG